MLEFVGVLLVPINNLHFSKETIKQIYKQMNKTITKVRNISIIVILVISTIFFAGVANMQKEQLKQTEEAAGIMSDIIRSYSDEDKEFKNYVENWFLDCVDADYEINNDEMMLEEYVYCY